MNARGLVRTLGGGVVAPRGFRAAAVAAGIAPGPPVLDLAVLAADVPVAAAAVFTTHRDPAAPVVVSRQHMALNGGMAQGVVLNSGSANAGTGSEGVTLAALMAAEAASGLACQAEQVLVVSTGVVGVLPPLVRASVAIRQAVSMMSAGEGVSVARALAGLAGLGSEHAVSMETARGAFVIGGMSAYWEAPHASAGTVAVITTDAWVAPSLLQEALEYCLRTTAVLGQGEETSANDSVIALASGASGVQVDDEDSCLALVEGLVAVARELMAARTPNVLLNVPVS